MALLFITKKNNHSQKGQTLIELLLAIGLAAVILPSLLTSLVASRDGRDQQKQRLEATGYLREANESIRVIKEQWSNIPSNGTYYPEIYNNTWRLTPGRELINNEFTREIEVENVYRDSNGAITLNPDPSDLIDPSTKRLVTTISWENPYSSSITSSTYITRHVNASFTQTTETTFNTGINTNTIVRSTTGTGIADDGEISLGAGGGGSWCNPNLSIQALDLPKNGVANAISAIEGKAFAGTGENASGVSYASINLANTNPPSGSIEGTFSGYKTNDIFGEENYAYIATDTNQKEVIIIDLTTYQEVGYFDAPGNGDGESVYVTGNIGFVTTGNTLYTFDLSSKSNARSLLGSITLSGRGMSIYVVDNYIYVAQSDSTQLRIIQVSTDGRTLNPAGQAQVAGGSGRDVFINSTGTRAYLATANSASQNELFIINIETKSGSRPIVGTYNTNGMDPNGVTVVPGNNAIIVGTGGIEYQVVDISNEASPGNCGELNIDSGVFGVASILEQDGDAFSYIITGDSSSEFKIIEGGPGGQYSTSGSYESPPFDAVSSATFNYFSANITQPASTTITLQVAVTNSSNCNTASYDFVGPDGTINTFYTVSGSIASGVIPYISSGNYQNPGRCFKYRANFNSGDSLSSPIFRDVVVNYSI